MILEQRQMRFDVFRAPKSWPVRPVRIERADPKRTGDRTHEHRAIARKPGQPARVEPLLRARLVAFAQFLRGGAEPRAPLPRQKMPDRMATVGLDQSALLGPPTRERKKP